jgi:hypothetical protein
MIRQLPAGHALVIRGGYSPVIARLPMVWKDPLYRHAACGVSEVRLASDLQRCVSVRDGP